MFALHDLYQTDTYSWLKNISEQKNHLLNNLAQSIVDLFDSNHQINFYIDILRHVNEPDIVNDFFPRLFKVTRAHPEYKKDIVKKLNNYQNSYIYQRIYIEYLIADHQYEKADQQMNLVKKRLNLKGKDGFDDLRMEIAFQLKDEDKSKRLAIEFTKEHFDDANFTAIKKFKKIFGKRWDDISQDIYDQLDDYFNKKTYAHFILEIKDHQRALHEVLSHSNEEILEKYKSLILERYPEIYYYHACQKIKSRSKIHLLSKLFA